MWKRRNLISPVTFWTSSSCFSPPVTISSLPVWHEHSQQTCSPPKLSKLSQQENIFPGGDEADTFTWADKSIPSRGEVSPGGGEGWFLHLSSSVREWEGSQRGRLSSQNASFDADEALRWWQSGEYLIEFSLWLTDRCWCFLGQEKKCSNTDFYNNAAFRSYGKITKTQMENTHCLQHIFPSSTIQPFSLNIVYR